jgi:hypothetical protein
MESDYTKGRAFPHEVIFAPLEVARQAVFVLLIWCVTGIITTSQVSCKLRAG